jgi:diadenosine tetraphosphate (Ap4A) HIT family hydrolase
MNDERFPWLLLIPRRRDKEEVLDLTDADQQQLWDEIRRVARTLESVFAPDKLNIAALGNQVRQLHVHIIARFQDDAAWPQPVWGVGQSEPWPDPAAVIARLRLALNSA